MLRLSLASIHLLALALGLGAVFARSAALRARPFTRRDVARAFKADNYWALAAALWLGTGLWRLLASTEKATSYYMQNPLFHAKLGCFAAILLLEIWPIVTLVRWRRAAARGGDAWMPDQSAARRIGIVGHVEATLAIVMVVLAAAMARGYGAR